MLLVLTVLLVLLALPSARAVLTVAWEAPFAWLVPLLAAVLIGIAPMMPDMIAGLSEDCRWMPGAWFSGAIALLGLSGWYWMRSVLAARYGAWSTDDWQQQYPQVQTELRLRDSQLYAIFWAPRLSLCFSALIAVAVAFGAGASWPEVVGVSLLVLALLPKTPWQDFFWRLAAVIVGLLLTWLGYRFNGRGGVGFSGQGGVGWHLTVCLVLALLASFWLLHYRRLLQEWIRNRLALVGAKGAPAAFGYPRTWRGFGRDLLRDAWLLLASGPLAVRHRFWGPLPSIVILLLAPAIMVWASEAPDWLPAAPTAAVLALAALIGPLTMLHAVLARIPPSPRTIAFLLLVSGLVYLTWDPPGLYAVRVVEGSADLVRKRPSLEEALQAWVKACPPRNDTDRIPVVIVAAEGGASRSALWTLAVLRQLDIATDNRFSRALFAFSGVSGGSLGAATYVAAQAKAPGHGGCGIDWTPKGAAHRAILEVATSDYLAPTLTQYFLTDVLRRLIVFGPVFSALGSETVPDRGLALEKAFEQGWDQAGLGKRPTLLAGRVAGQPHLLLNGTSVQTSRRLIVSTIRFDSGIAASGDARQLGQGGTSDRPPVSGADNPLTKPPADDVTFADAEDFLTVLGGDVPLSTAVTSSARFPLISPAGRFVRPPDAGSSGETSLTGPRALRFVARQFCLLAAWISHGINKEACQKDARTGTIVDGGYFENYGALTALELARKIAALPKAKYRPIVVVISNDTPAIASKLRGPVLTCNDYRLLNDRASASLGPRYGNELWAPIETLFATRSAHGQAALHALRRELCDYQAAQPYPAFVHIEMPEMAVHKSPPLNWVLNKGTQDFMIGNGFDTKHAEAASAWAELDSSQARLLRPLLGLDAKGQHDAPASFKRYTPPE